VGRGKTVVKHHLGDDTEVLLAEHHMPLRSAVRSHRGQWQAI
jgi:hypothetical protein